MEGKRFVFGLAAGLLVGLAVVTTAGGFGPTPTSVLLYSSKGAANTSMEAATITMTVTAATTQASTTYGSSSPPYAVTTTTGAATSSGSTPSSTTSGQSGSANENQPTLSSQIYSITTQPPLSNAIILVPILLAFLLGAVLYRVSVRGKAEPDGE